MSFSSLSEFIAMGGHGPYVWSAYAIAFAVIVFNLVVPGRLKRRALQQQARQLRREQQNASAT